MTANDSGPDRPVPVLAHLELLLDGEGARAQRSAAGVLSVAARGGTLETLFEATMRE